MTRLNFAKLVSTSVEKNYLYLQACEHKFLYFFVGLKLVGTNLDGGGVVGVDAVGRGEEVPGRREHDLGLGRQRRRNLSHPGLDFLK